VHSQEAVFTLCAGKLPGSDGPVTGEPAEMSEGVQCWAEVLDGEPDL